jgi:hypothetical protein
VAASARSNVGAFSGLTPRRSDPRCKRSVPPWREVWKMAGPSDPWPLWAQEASGTSGAPTMARLLAAGALVAALTLAAAAAQPATHSGRSLQHVTTSPACAELGRLRSHGILEGAQVDRLRVACSRSRDR